MIDPLLERLVRSASYRRLSSVEQDDARALAVGPNLGSFATKSRRAAFTKRWEGRKRELIAGLDRGVDHLRAMLYAPSRVVHFLDASCVNGHAAVVFGDPAERTALCYGRRWVRSKDHRIKLVLMSPDSTIASGWDRPAGDAEVRYAAKRILISRLEEHALVQWSEDNFAFAHPNELKSLLPGPLPAPIRGATFTDEAHLALLRFAAGRPGMFVENLVLRAGRA